MKSLSFTYRINNQIHASEVRLIGPDGKQEGVFSLTDALKKAQVAGLDLVEIAPNAKPPVVKIVELGKFRYEQEKKLKKEKKKSKASELKEVRFSPFIANHDYATRMEKIREFLDESNKVRVVVVFMGRQMNSKSFGYELIKRITGELGERIVIDMEPKFIGRHLITTLSPLKKSKKTEDQENTNYAETKNQENTN